MNTFYGSVPLASRGGEKTLHPETLEWFEQYHWPGNIRELENVIYREYLLADGSLADPHKTRTAPRSAERRGEIERRRAHLTRMNFNEAKKQAIAKFEQCYLA